VRTAGTRDIRVGLVKDLLALNVIRKIGYRQKHRHIQGEYYVVPRALPLPAPPLLLPSPLVPLLVPAVVPPLAVPFTPPCPPTPT
jgi:hypothetical protein